MKCKVTQLKSKNLGESIEEVDFRQHKCEATCQFLHSRLQSISMVSPGSDHDAV